jgi:hypothetical protein
MKEQEEMIRVLGQAISDHKWADRRRYNRIDSTTARLIGVNGVEVTYLTTLNIGDGANGFYDRKTLTKKIVDQSRVFVKEYTKLLKEKCEELGKTYKMTPVPNTEVFNFQRTSSPGPQNKTEFVYRVLLTVEDE